MSKDFKKEAKHYLSVIADLYALKKLSEEAYHRLRRQSERLEELGEEIEEGNVAAIPEAIEMSAEIGGELAAAGG